MAAEEEVVQHAHWGQARQAGQIIQPPNEASTPTSATISVQKRRSAHDAAPHERAMCFDREFRTYCSQSGMRFPLHGTLFRSERLAGWLDTKLSSPKTTSLIDTWRAYDLAKTKKS